MSLEIVAAGLNHKGAPIELREKLAVPEGALKQTLVELAKQTGTRETVLLSTCNRVEVYAVGDQASDPGPRILDALARLRRIDHELLDRHGFLLRSEAAARHIFRVTASLESMVVGEPQILGQVKEAVQRARESELMGPILDRCFGMAFRSAKRVRTETGISRGGASVPSVSVDLARSIFGDLAGHAAMIVGAGEMAEQAGIHLDAAGVSEIVVVNRSAEAGQALAERVRGHHVGWSRLEPELGRTDIVVTSTASEEPVIRPHMLRSAMKARRRRPIFLIDIAVPRDVDPEVGELDHVFLYNIDDLQTVVHDNLRARSAEAQRAGALVDEEVASFVGWQRARAVGPLIGRLQQLGKGIVDAEVGRALGRLRDLAPEQQAVVEQLGHQIMQKLLHRPMTNVREACAAENGDGIDGGELADALQALFGLEPETAAQPETSPETVSPDSARVARPEPSS
jgi:glutamyl-tRNA reductase